MFDSIAHRYDLLNHVLSLGLDVRWRSAAIRRVLEGNPVRVLDVATGTGDMAIGCSRAGTPFVAGLDVSRRMLDRALRKAGSGQVHVHFLQGCAEALPFRDGSFDAACVAFGVRNFEHLERGIAELHRALRPGARLVVLEFSRTQTPLFRSVFSVYFHQILPRVGRWVSSDPEAYQYLPDTVDAFPHGAELLALLRRGGFLDARFRRMTLGVVTLYEAIR